MKIIQTRAQAYMKANPTETRLGVTNGRYSSRDHTYNGVGDLRKDMVPRRRVAGPPPPSHASRSSKQSYVIRVTAPPKLGLGPWPTGGERGAHGTTRQGTTGAGWGRITHNTTTQGTTGPLPLPLLFDTQTIMMAMMLCTMTLTCYSQCGCWWYLFSYAALGFGSACSLLYLVENRAWLVMFFLGAQVRNGSIHGPSPEVPNTIVSVVSWGLSP